MRVILNSDVIYVTYALRESLPEGLARLCAVCADLGHVIVVPSTTLLEFNREQRRQLENLRRELRNSLRTLEKYEIGHAPVVPEDVLPEFDLVAMMTSLGVQVEVVEPSLEHYSDAHRRACLRESPHSGDTKSDEMRDLIIWAMSIAIASRDGGALLVSRDAVHTNVSGNDEAANAGLIRVIDFDQALDHLQVATPAFELSKRILEPLWAAVGAAGIPIGARPELLRVTDATFVRGSTEIVTASFGVSLRGDSGALIEAQVTVDRTSGTELAVNLERVSVEGALRPDLRLRLPNDTVPEYDYPMDAPAWGDSDPD